MANECAAALACAFLHYANYPWYEETDQRFNDRSDYKFRNSGAIDAYDYQAIAVHESGHSLGLDHANSSKYLSMYYQASPNTTRWRTLALGDVAIPKGTL